MSPLILYLVTTRSSAIVCSCSSSDILAVEFQSPVGRSKRQTPALPLSFGCPCLREHQPGLRTKTRPLYHDVNNVTAPTTRQKCSRNYSEKELLLTLCFGSSLALLWLIPYIFCSRNASLFWLMSARETQLSSTIQSEWTVKICYLILYFKWNHEYF